MDTRAWKASLCVVGVAAIVACSSSTEPPPCANEACTYARQFDEAASYFREFAGEPPDEAVIRAARAEVEASPTPATLVRSVHEVVLSIPIGHQVVETADACAAPSHLLPKEVQSRFGVCGRPFEDSVVVTYARDGNALGLRKGDVVRAVDDVRGTDLFGFVVHRIACGSSTLTPSGVRATGAASLFGVVAPGSKLEVVSEGGAVKTVTVPEASDGAWTSCRDPFNPLPENIATTTTRPDGIIVVRIARFRPLGTTEEEMEKNSDAFLLTFRDALVKAAGKPVVIDLRGNAGGLADFVAGTVGMLPEARAAAIGSCVYKQMSGERSPSPPTLVSKDEIMPVQPVPKRVVMLIDGLCVSGGDYMPFMAQRLARVTIVGTPTSGELNTGQAIYKELPGPVPLRLKASGSLCFDDDGQPLAGKGAKVDHVVELTPSDLARGIDTQLEAAIRVALAP